MQGTPEPHTQTHTPLLELPQLNNAQTQEPRQLQHVVYFSFRVLMCFTNEYDCNYQCFVMIKLCYAYVEMKLKPE